MAGLDSSGSPLKTAAGTVGREATRAFELLGSETRLAILLVWEAYEPFAGDDALSFPELLDRVDYDTSSNFSYHLEKLFRVFMMEVPPTSLFRPTVVARTFSPFA